MVRTDEKRTRVVSQVEAAGGEIAGQEREKQLGDLCLEASCFNPLLLRFVPSSSS